MILARNYAQCHVHVGKCEIHLLRSLLCHREVRQNNVDLSCLEIFNSARGLSGYVVDLYAQVLSDPFGKIYIISLVLPVLIYITKRVFVRENADVYSSALLDLIQRPIDFSTVLFLTLSLILTLSSR